MLLALWPLFIVQLPLAESPDAHSNITQRARIAHEQQRRRKQQVATPQQNDEGTANVSYNASGSASGAVDLGSLSGSIEPVGNVAVRIPRHEPPLAGGIPEALGTSIAARDVVSLGQLDEAMKRYAAKQAADEDDEMAMLIILAGM